MIARASKDNAKCYIAWVYDSPMELRDVSLLAFETNRVFTFDRTECIRLNRMGYGNVFYLPLAGDVETKRSLKPWKKKADISLVGSLYQSTLPVLLSGMDDFERGYMEALLAAQQKVYGGYIVPELLTPDIIDKINGSFAKQVDGDFQVNEAELSYSIAAELTHRERLLLLRLLAMRFQTVLYTFAISGEDRMLLQGVSVESAVDYDTQMPRVFASTKINLNPILKANGDGIPLRALDVMSCGGFLLSSWRDDFLNYFEPDEEIVLYTDIEDAVEKAEFYMKNDDSRSKIAAAGQKRIEKDFRYEDRLDKMFEYI